MQMAPKMQQQYSPRFQFRNLSSSIINDVVVLDFYYDVQVSLGGSEDGDVLACVLDGWDARYEEDEEDVVDVGLE